MSQLASLLEAHADNLVRRWEAQVRERLGPAGNSAPELREQLPLLIEKLAAALRRGRASAGHARALAQEAARPALRHGFDLEGVLREYALFHSLILDLLEEVGHPPVLGELRVLSELMAAAVAEAAAEHARQAEHARRAAQEGHVAALRERDALFQEAQAARATAEAERQKLDSLFTQAPVGIAIHEGPQHIYTFANPSYRALVGNRELVGKRLLEAVPELAGQGFDALFDRVVSTGETYVDHEVPARVDRAGDGTLEDGFYKVVFTAKRNAEGQIDGVLQSATDVTQETRARRNLEALTQQVRTSEAELRLVMDSIPVLVSFVGKDERYRAVNRAYEDWFGLPKEALIGKTLEEVVGGAAYQALEPYVRRGLAGERFTFEQHGVPYRYGGTRDVRVTFVPHREPAGTVDGYVALVEDVTQQRRLESEREALLAGAQAARADAEAERQKLYAMFLRLRESEERLRQVIEASGAGIWEVRSGTGEVIADARIRELFGVAPAAPFTLDTALAAIHPEDRARVAHAIEQALAGKDGGFYQMEHRVCVPGDDATRWIDARGSAHIGPDGKALRFWGTGLDISARKEAEASQARFLSALENQPLLYVAVLSGRELRFELANAGYRQIVGGRDVVGKTLHEALPELIGQGFDALLLEVLETGKAFVGHEIHTRLDRRGAGLEDAYFNFVYQAVAGPQGRSEFVLVIGHDVTDDVLARREALRVEKERSDFEQQLIGIVSHDLRTPLNAISLGASTLLGRQGDMDPREAKILTRIQSSAERMGRMIRDLLDFTQARLGIRISPRPLDLHDFAETVLEDVRVSFPGRALRFEAVGDGHGTWDPDRLAQVLTNLVSNAFKYSPADTQVTVCTRGQGDEVLLEVHNLGSPIPQEALQHLFRPMWRASAQLDRAGRSVGLGLYIVKHLVDAHGGSVSVQSSADTGTLFTVRMPRELPELALAAAK